MQTSKVTEDMSYLTQHNTVGINLVRSITSTLSGYEGADKQSILREKLRDRPPISIYCVPGGYTRMDAMRLLGRVRVQTRCVSVAAGYCVVVEKRIPEH